MELTIGCTTRPYGDLSFHAACERIAAAGYTDVALFRGAGVDAASTSDQVQRARRIAEDAGLVPSMLIGQAPVSLGIDAALSEYKRLIDNAAGLGAAWVLELGLGDRDLLDDYVTVMQHAAEHAQSAGVRITLKPHGGITTTTADLIAVHNRIGHPAFGICYDPGNIIYYTKGAELPTEHIAEVAPLTTTGIIKDCVIRDGTPDVLITPGEGLVNWPAVFAGLASGGFCGPLYLECVRGHTLDEIDHNVCRTRAFVRGLLAQIDADAAG